MKFMFIASRHGEHAVSRMCMTLGVSRGSYYAWKKRKPGKRALENARLLEDIQRIHDDSGGNYGYRPMQAQLLAEGRAVNRKRVARLMKLAGIEGRSKGGNKGSRRGSHNPPAENLLQQDFHADAPDRKWLADIVHIDTGQGKLKAAVVLDAYSRRAIGWAFGVRETSELAQRALKMALGTRKLDGGKLIHHSDQGSPYRDKGYRQMLADHGIEMSMSRAGNCYDNAMVESFFATLRNEMAGKKFATYDKARSALFAHIELWYNRRRLHGSLGYMSPMEYERRAGHSR